MLVCFQTTATDVNLDGAVITYSMNLLNPALEPLRENLMLVHCHKALHLWFFIL